MSILATDRRRAALLPAGGRVGRFGPVAAALLALLVTVLLVLAAAPARAHAELTGSDPVPDQVLPTSPASIRLTFTEPVRLTGTGTKLLSVDGDEVAVKAAATDREVVLTPEEPLADGSWLAAWRVTSADGHPISGALPFAVGAPSNGTSASDGFADPQFKGVGGEERREVNLVRMVAGAARYVGFALAIGLALFVGFVWRRPAPKPGQVDEEPVKAVQAGLVRWALAGLVLGLVAHLVLIPTQVVWVGGGPWSSVGDAATWKASQTGSTMLVLVLLVFTAVIGALALLRRSGGLALFALVLLVAAWAAEGHTRTVTPTLLVVGADAVHIGAGVFWIGGLVGLAVLLRGRLPAKETAEVVARFSAAAAVCVALVAAAGLLLFWAIAPGWSTLWQTGYGRIVLAKAAVVVLPVAALAAWNRWKLVPAVTAGAGRERLVRSVKAEAGLLVGVLCLTGVLTTQSPLAGDTSNLPPVTAAPAGPQTLRLDLGEDRRATLEVDPARQGRNTVRVRITDGSGSPLETAAEVTLTATHRKAELGPLQVPLTGKDQLWTGAVDLPVGGEWTLSLSVPFSEFENPVVSEELQVP